MVVDLIFLWVEPSIFQLYYHWAPVLEAGARVQFTADRPGYQVGEEKFTIRLPRNIVHSMRLSVVYIVQ